jgi:protease-4
MRHLLPLLMLGSLVTAAEQPAPATAPAKGSGTLIMQLSGSFPLRPASLFFADRDSSLHDATMNLRQALAEPEPRLVLDLTEGFQPNLAAAEELAAVLRARPAGKHVACLLDNAQDNALVVAAACDEVAMSSAGILMIDGLAASSDYYADALAKVGVKFHAVTSGPAKTAPEALTRNQPSEAAIKEHEHLVFGLDRVLVEESARGGLDAAGVQAARARAPQTSSIAVAAKLADRAVEPGAWLRDQPGPVRHFSSGRDLPDLGSLSGMVSFWKTLMEGDQPPKHAQMVAVVELEGMIIDGEVSLPGETIAGTDTADLFDRLATDAHVVAVVVRVNSGGGSAGASDRIHFAVRRCAAAKPVVALFDGVAASGGYYLGCAAREIMVHRGTITGSIGVFAVTPDLEGTRELLGIHRHTISTGPRADLFSTGPFTAEKEAGLRQVIAAVDARFQGLVAERRKLDPAKVAELAGGRVYGGDEAIALGLADRLGDLPTAVARARELAGIKNPLPIERLPRGGGLAARLGLGTSLGPIPGAALPAGLDLPADLRGWLALALTRRPLVMAWSAGLDLR